MLYCVALSRRRSASAAKTLRNSLSSLGCDKALIKQALEAASIEDSRRAETLSVAEFVALADAFYEGGLS